MSAAVHRVGSTLIIYDPTLSHRTYICFFLTWSLSAAIACLYHLLYVINILSSWTFSVTVALLITVSLSYYCWIILHIFISCLILLFSCSILLFLLLLFISNFSMLFVAHFSKLHLTMPYYSTLHPFIIIKYRRSSVLSVTSLKLQNAILLISWKWSRVVRINRSILTANQVTFRKLKKDLRNREISLETNERMLNCYITPVIPYGRE